MAQAQGHGTMRILSIRASRYIMQGLSFEALCIRVVMAASDLDWIFLGILTSGFEQCVTERNEERKSLHYPAELMTSIIRGTSTWYGIGIQLGLQDKAIKVGKKEKLTCPEFDYYHEPHIAPARSA